MDHDASTMFEESDSLKLRPGDYVSPGLRVVVIDSCFPKMKVGDIEYVFLALDSYLSSHDTGSDFTTIILSIVHMIICPICTDMA
jgi:hypothetical protein